MGILDGTKIGMANRFSVIVTPGDHDLGTWAQVQGLQVKWEVGEYRAGDQGNARWILPGKTTYQPVKLIRAACDDSKKVQTWLSETSHKHKTHEVTINLFDTVYKAGEEIISWTLENALPSSWEIAGFDAGASKVALETLTFEHTGFLADQQTVKAGAPAPPAGA